jgi:response regulator RpfG family c-di-GMP phosphodiesterase
MSITSERKLYILIDDDETHNAIARLLISNTVHKAEVITFENPRDGLFYLKGEFAIDEPRRATLLLNLHMPSMSGWEVINELTDMNKAVLDRIRVYILTSSIDPSNRKRSKEIEIVKGYLDKPLTREWILELQGFL